MKKANPAVSILVPVYNVAGYLRQCLDSLIGQSLKEIEIVCVNDGSTDASLEILQEYAAKDNRVVIVDKANGGLPSARNAGLDAAKGEYVGFVDGDDLVDKDMFKRMYRKARSQKADIVVCGAYVFPDENDADDWMRSTLSPHDAMYKNGYDALFMESSAKPFLWRDLVSRDLIERNGFRLDESVVIGEDQAFQFKIFPAARRIAFMSSKLYYYRYNRHDSIMGGVQYRDYGRRISRHVHMLDSIIGSWRQYDVDRQTAVRFIEWCVDFIFYDLVKVSANDRIRISKEFCRLLIDYGYYNFCKDCSQGTRNHFEYMSKLASETAEEPVVTIVASFGKDSLYMPSFLDSLLGQSEKRIEVVLYENGSDDATKKVIWGKLYRDFRICLRLGAPAPESEKYNDAITTATGEYICFLSPLDPLKGTEWTSRAVREFEDKSIDIVGHKEGLAGEAGIRACQNAYWREFIYRTGKIRSCNICFDPCALMTGRVFFTKYCLASKSCFFIPEFMHRSGKRMRDSIGALEADRTLKAFVWLLEAAKSNKLDALAEHVTDTLNSENYVRLITDTVSRIDENASASGVPEENYVAEILELLIKANRLSQPSGGNAMLRPLARVIERRHQLLERI